MIDPLAEVILLLRPGAPFSKAVSAAGRRRIRRSEYGQPFYCVVLEGSCRLAVDGAGSTIVAPGDFVLIPSADSFTMSSIEPPDSDDAPVLRAEGEYRVGKQSGVPEMRAVVGYCEFGSSDAALLLSLLPRLLHVRGESRLATLMQLVGEESRSERPARDVILARLLEVLLIEALRSSASTPASSGLARGLADERLATAIRRMHEDPARAWTVAQLASEAALSRSAFFERFSRAVGVAPMEYLLTWRMALAKQLLRKTNAPSPRLPSASAIVPRVRLAWPSRVMWDHRQCDMRASFVRLNPRSTTVLACNDDKGLLVSRLHMDRARFPIKAEVPQGRACLSRLRNRF